MRRVLAPWSEKGNGDATWRPLRDDTGLSTLIAALLSLVLVMTVFVAWLLCSARLVVAIDYSTWIVAALLVALLHEWSRTLAFPIRRSHVSVVFSLSKFVLCAEYDGVVTRNRYVAILLIPFIVVSVLPVLLFWGVDYAPPPLVVALSLFSALVSGADVVGAVATLVELPSTAIIRSRGGTTRWKARHRNLV